MGVPLNLQDIQSGFLSASAHTANNTLIEEALDKALDRTGSTNNAMETDLDMGLNQINNLNRAFQDHQAIPFGQASGLIVASGSEVTSTAERDLFTAAESQTVFNLNNIEYIEGTNSLIVFINGVYQTAGVDYEETSTTSITFNSALSAGDIVAVIGARFNAEVFVTESQGFAAASEDSSIEAASSATEAENWANREEDSLVPEGDGVDDYSALHWARKSEDAAGYKLGINNQSGTTYTLVASDEGDLIRMTNASDNTVTVPTNSSVAFEVGTIVNVRQAGEGTTTISPASGVTINSPQNEFTTDGEEFGIGLVKVATDEWDLVKSYAGVRADQFDSDILPTPAAEGYQIFPTGLIFQWGRTPLNLGTPSSPRAVTFPIAFPSACINVQATYGDNTDADGDNLWVQNLDTTGFNIYQNGDSGNTAYWFAIGA